MRKISTLIAELEREDYSLGSCRFPGNWFAIREDCAIGPKEMRVLAEHAREVGATPVKEWNDTLEGAIAATKMARHEVLVLVEEVGIPLLQSTSR